MAYGPENERSEFVTPANFSEGCVLERTRRFQVASAAFIRPARSPTRGSGLGGVVAMSNLEVAHAARASAAIANDSERTLILEGMWRIPMRGVGTTGLRASSACGRFRWFDRRRCRTRTCR